MADKAATQPKKKREMLTSFSIILILLAVVALVTIALSGATADVTGATLSDVIMAPVRGFKDAVDVCLFVMILGGFLGIVNKTNSLSTGIQVLVRKMNGNELKLIPILMFLFAILGSTYGFCEETVGFYALLAATMMAAGYDALTGAAMILLGAGVGCLGSTVNPFATGVASAALTDMGIEVNQGIIIALGLILLVATYLVSVFFVLRYAKKVKANKEATMMTASELEAAEASYGEASKSNANAELTGKQKAVLWLFGAAFLVMIIGFVPWQKLGVDFFAAGSTETVTEDAITGDDIVAGWSDAGASGDLAFNAEPDATLTTTTDTPGWSGILTGANLGDWYFAESTTWFLLLAIIIGIVYGFSEHEIVDTFMAGCGDMMSVVMIIAVSRGVSVLMSSTGLSTYVLNSAANALSGTSAGVFAVGSYLLYFVLSFLIPSTSGMATVSMPIMGPLAAQLGFNPAVMVMVFSAASGAVNLITPTSGAIMGGLALARVEYGTWVKFAVKIVLFTALVSMVILTIAMMVL